MNQLKKNKSKNRTQSRKDKPVVLLDFDIDQFLLNREIRQHKNKS